jgi:predicted secreted Zn-dependent protease
MSIPGFIKGVVVFLLLATIALPVAASETGLAVANIDTDVRPRMKNSVVPPVVTEKFEYYEVCGCNEKELQCDIKKKCIQWSDGKKYDAVTTWNVNWDYGYDNAPQSCAADSFKVTVEILFRYPKWARTPDAPPQLVEKWDQYMKNLIIHENGHRDIAVQAAEKLSRAVAALPPASSCVELDRRVKALYRSRMEKLDRDQKSYDAATNHGVTQGALFP